MIDNVLSLDHSDSFYDDEFQEGYEMDLVNQTRYFIQEDDGQIVNLYDDDLNDQLEFVKLVEFINQCQN